MGARSSRQTILSWILYNAINTEVFRRRDADGCDRDCSTQHICMDTAKLYPCRREKRRTKIRQDFQDEQDFLTAYR